jgi:phosphoribosyl-ATP pyrophosphohydrolase
MANMIARLGVVLGLDSAEFTKGIEAAGKKLEQFSQAAERVGKNAAVAMVAATAAAVRYADEMADVLFVLICLANQTGIDLATALEKNIQKKTQRDGSRHQNNEKLHR